MRQLVLACAVCLLLVTGCTSADSSSDPPRQEASAPAGPPTITRAWEWRARVVTQPEPAGDDTAVVLITEDRDLLVVAIDVAEGRELWRRRATPAAASSWLGVHAEVMEHDGRHYVAYFAPGRRGPQAQLVVADARTGKEQWRSRDRSFTSWVGPCAGSTGVCTESAGDVWRLEPGSWRLRAVTRSLPAGRRLTSGGLVSTHARPGEELALVHNGRVRWRRPVTAYFPSGASSDLNWFFEERDGVLYGYLGVADPVPTRADLSQRTDVGIDAATGRLLWKRSGSRMDCYGMVEDWAEKEDRSPVRCRAHGTLRVENDRVVGVGKGITIEGFDPATGRTTWRYPVVHDVAFSRGGHDSQYGEGGAPLFHDGRRRRVLDLVTGKDRRPRRGEVFYCAEWTGFHLDHDPDEHHGDNVLRRCDAKGTSVDGLPSASLLESLGQRMGDRVVVSEQGRLAAYEVSRDLRRP